MSFLILELVFACSRFNYGYFIRFNGKEIEYNDVVLGLLFVFSILYFLRNGKCNQKLFLYSILLIGTIFIGFILCVLIPSQVKIVDYNHSWDLYFRGDVGQLKTPQFSLQSILMFIRVLIFLCILNTSKNMFTYYDWIRISSIVLKFLQVILIYGVIEILLKYILHFNINVLMNWFFGRGVSTGGGLNRLQGISREPSYYSLALFNYICIALFYNRLNNKIKIYDKWILLAVFIGCLSTSFSFLICLASIFLMYCFLTGKDVNRVLLILFVLLVFIFSLFFVFFSDIIVFLKSSPFVVFNRIAESIIQIKNGFSGTFSVGRDFSSETSRLVGGILTFKAGFSRPVFGLGLGTAYCVMGLFATFANIGITGTILWISILFRKYAGAIPWVVTFIIILPIIFCNDLYTLYDTSYVLMLPLASYSFAKNNKREIG